MKCIETAQGLIFCALCAIIKFVVFKKHEGGASFLMTERFHFKRSRCKKEQAFLSVINGLRTKITAAFKECSRDRMRRLLPEAGIAVLALGVAIYMIYVLAKPITLVAYADGVKLGAVENSETVTRAMSMANEKISSADITQSGDMLKVRYKFELRGDDKILSVDECSEKIISHISDYYTRAYALYLDGSYIGACANRGEVSGVIEKLEADKQLECVESGGDGDYFYLGNDVEIVYSLCPNKDIVSENDLYIRLSGRMTSQSEAVPVSGEAEDTSRISALSHDVVPDVTAQIENSKVRSTDGADSYDTLAAGASAPVLTYVSANEEVHTGIIPYNTMYVEDNTMAKGVSVMISAGEDGVENKIYNDVLLPDGNTEKKLASTETVTVKSDCVWRVGTSEDPVRAGTGSFIWPLNDVSITSEYGDSRFEYDGSPYHYGIDLDGKRGDSIYASDGGKVIFSGYRGSYGLTVIIDHGGGLTTVYAHQSKLYVSEGESVYKGQLIGLIGSTGVATGSHLHFEVRVNGEDTDPTAYMPVQSRVD